MYLLFKMEHHCRKRYKIFYL